MSVSVQSARGMPEETSPGYAGWRVVAACFVIATFSWGFCFYGHGVYLAELKAAHGWPASVIAGATTAFYLFSAVLSAFVGDVIARFGARAVASAGVVFIGVAAALIPAVAQPWQLYVVYSVMAFGWAATSLTAITTILGMWFSEKRGLAISIGLTGASFGGILVVPLLALASASFGFAASLVSVAVCVGLVAATLALIFFDASPPYRPVKAPGTISAPASSRLSWLGSPSFWSITGPFALAFFAQVGFLVHQIALLEPTVGRATAGFAVGLTTATAVGGRFVLGAFVDRIDQRLAAGASFFSQAAALGVVWLSRDPAVLVAACAVFGFSVGNVITLPALIIGREFRPEQFATVVGLSNATCQILYSFGPGLLGGLRDLTGSYDAPLILCATLDCVACAGIVAGSLRAKHTR